VVQPDSVSDDLGGKAVAVVGIGREFHDSSLAGLERSCRIGYRDNAPTPLIPISDTTRVIRQRGRGSLTEERWWSRASIPRRVAARSMLAALARPGRSATGPVHRASAHNRRPSCIASPCSRPRSPAGLTLSTLGKYLRRLRVPAGRLNGIEPLRALAFSYRNGQAQNPRKRAGQLSLPEHGTSRRGYRSTLS